MWTTVKRLFVAYIAFLVIFGLIMLVFGSLLGPNETISIMGGIVGVWVTYKYIWPFLCLRIRTPDAAPE